jgi:2-polyprenyl-3-methyl-5-hydroxy-6-metoxy-1,4-benzoquinol methylase
MRALLGSVHEKMRSLDGETEHVVRLVSAACATSGRRVLDVGCGYGRLLSQLQAAGLEATGVDINPQIVAAARDPR